MTSILIVLLALSGMVVAQTTEEIFSISPYTIRNEVGEVILKFEVKNDEELKILREDGFENHDKEIIQKYLGGQLNSINLGVQTCAQSANIKIHSLTQNNVILQQRIPSRNCPDTKHDNGFVFGFISDTQEIIERHRTISKIISLQMKRAPHQFIINAGDIVDNGSVKEYWYDFFREAKPYLSQTPIIGVVGNHDYYGTKKKNQLPFYFKKYFRGEKVEQLGNLSIPFENFRLVVFNSNFWRLSRKFEKKQFHWIEEQFKLAQVEKKPVIISMHYPVFSSSLNKFTSGAVRKMRNKLVPLLEKYRIPLVLSGHTHMYERSYKNGVNYVVAGPAGGHANQPTWGNKYSKYLNFHDLTYTKITIFDKILRIQTFNQYNRVIDKLFINLNVF